MIIKPQQGASAPELRVYQLLWLLLQANGYLKMDEIADRFHLSKSALAEVMKETRKVLYSYELELNQKPYYGLLVEGSELQYRRCMAKTLAVIGDEGQTAAELQYICNCIITCLQIQSYEIADDALKSAGYYIYANILRMQKGQYLKAVLIEDTSGTINTLVVDELVNLLAKQYQVVISDTEKTQLRIYLEAFRYRLGNTDGQDGRPVIRADIFNIVQEMILAVYDSYQIDFRNDFDLIMSLCLHLEPLHLRLSHLVECCNPLLAEIKTGFSLAYNMAIQACSVITRCWERTISEDEIGYIALAFALAIEKMKNAVTKKRILLVCGTGSGGAQLLAYQYQNRFQNYLSELKVCNLTELNRIDLTSYDFIFTIVPIPEPMPIPVVFLENFFEERDIQRVKKTLLIKSQAGVEKYFPENLFLTDLCFTSKNELLEYLCRYVMKERNVSASFYDEVLKRERLAKTEYGNYVAMPHPYKMEQDQTFVCVAILDEPIIWVKRKVQVVFLVSVGKSDIEDLQSFYRVTSEFLMNRSYVKSLIRGKDYSRFIKTLKKIQMTEGDI